MHDVVVGARTDVGHVRPLNEDALLLGEQVWAVADGMGGHAAGNVASRLAVEALKVLDEATDLTPGDVVEAVLAANLAVLGHGADHPDARGLGTTLTGLAKVVVDGVPRWAVFNVGDSRVYRFAAGRLTQVSIDHSEVEELVAEGVLDAAQARTHPGRHVITRSVGTRPAPQVDVWLLPQAAGERFLLCSDGLNSELDDERIAAVLAQHADPRAAASALVDAVLTTEARDNVTVLVVDVTGVAGQATTATGAGQPAREEERV